MFDQNTALPKSMKWLKVAVITLSVITVALVGVLAYGMYFQKDNGEPQIAEVSKTPEATATAESDVVVDEGVTWTAPEKMDDLGLVVRDEGACSGNTDYYRVGTTASKSNIILINAKCEELGTVEHLYRVVEIGGSYKLAVQNSDKWDANGLSFDWKKVTADRTLVFKSLLPETVISKGHTRIIASGEGWYDESIEAEKSKIADTSWGPLYRQYTQDLSINSTDNESTDKEVIAKVARYFIKLNDSTKVTYEPRPDFLLDDNTMNLTYDLSSAEGASYEKIATSGCGVGFGSFPAVILPLTVTDATQVGSIDGDKVYTIEDEENKLVKFAFAVHNMGGDEDKSSMQDFLADTPVVYWTNAYGDTILYLNLKFMPNVECGKPVVYLYPTETTNFEVRVGADVTVSDPLYLSSWVGTAEPDGTLTVAGKSYGSLFWEGDGWGQYPVVDFGQVVKRDKAESTIENNLRQMSLNDREIADFMDFWAPKLPESDYVRLSWLTNEEMDELAPLKVTPTPDSTIRVFLDFDGLSAPVSIQPQTLPSFPRDGFTVVEWGGLLHQ